MFSNFLLILRPQCDQVEYVYWIETNIKYIKYFYKPLLHLPILLGGLQRGQVAVRGRGGAHGLRVLPCRVPPADGEAPRGSPAAGPAAGARAGQGRPGEGARGTQGSQRQDGTAGCILCLICLFLLKKTFVQLVQSTNTYKYNPIKFH